MHTIEPADDYLADLTARTDALLARLRDDRGPLVVVDHALLNAWADSSSREWDVDQESAA